MTIKRTFTKQEKLQNIKESSELWVKASLEKHGIHAGSLKAKSAVFIERFKIK